MPSSCSVDDCSSPTEAKGLCLKHYMRLRRSGTTDVVPRPPKDRRCSLPDCEAKHLARDYCRVHYERLVKTGTTDPPPRRRGCSIDGCERPHFGRGWCQLHYDRWRAQGDPLVSLHERTPAERFWPRVDRSAGPKACWPWLGGCDSDGYGTVTINYRQIGSHRVAYELLVGPIPDGLTIDHLCRNVVCQNPAHMEPVTMEENVRRARAVARAV